MAYLVHQLCCIHDYLGPSCRPWVDELMDGPVLCKNDSKKKCCQGIEDVLPTRCRRAFRLTPGLLFLACYQLSCRLVTSSPTHPDAFGVSWPWCALVSSSNSLGFLFSHSPASCFSFCRRRQRYQQVVAWLVEDG